MPEDKDIAKDAVTGDAPTPVTITLTRHREPDWLLGETLDSLEKQKGITGEVLFLDQNWREDYARAVEARSNAALVFRCVPCEDKGIAHARNRGLELAAYDTVLCVDSDVIAEPDWAMRMAEALSQPGVAIVGARIVPRWRARPPVLARSKVVLDQYSMLDLGVETKTCARIVGAGFGLCKTAAPDQMYFDTNFGRREGKLFGGEETDLCRRVLAVLPHGIVYVGTAVVHHQVLPERLRWSWVWRRLYYAGLGRAQMGGAPKPSQDLSLADWLLLPFILPPYVAGYLVARLKGLLE